MTNVYSKLEFFMIFNSDTLLFLTAVAYTARLNLLVAYTYALESNVDDFIPKQK